MIREKIARRLHLILVVKNLQVNLLKRLHLLLKTHPNKIHKYPLKIKILDKIKTKRI